ncbi:hypothetical protein CK203_090260 [Vitis vinifera]|uniref:Retrotransposon gag domain-containing protein n=1 Tax=Vitis vinifera TaxID=29760 RepID=A0A438DSI1_VITVI|nr:hypothetical protein CK203_090260 [Vitis vinifera]
MAPNHRKKTVGKRTTTESSPPGDRKIKRRKRVLRIQASTSGPPRRQRSRGQVANSRPDQNQYIRDNRSPRSMQQKDNVRKSQLSNSMRARLGPQEPGRSRPPVATTWAPRPDPMVTPMVQNVHPHRDPMVTPMMRNVHSHLAAQQAGRNLPNEPPIGSSAKGWMTCSPRLSALTSSITSPQGDSSYQNFPHTMVQRSLRSYHALSTADDARYWQRRTTCAKDLSEAFVGQYLCSARHKQNISTLQNIKMQDNESLREFVKRFGQAVLQVEACSMDAVLQIFKRSICPGTPFFESLAKNLLQRWTTCSDVPTNIQCSKMTCVATQQVLVAGRPSRGDPERNAKPPDRPSRPTEGRRDRSPG